MWNECRMRLAERLLLFATRLAPKDHPDMPALAGCVLVYYVASLKRKVSVQQR